MDHQTASAIIQSLPFPVVMTDVELRVLHLNSSASTMLGLDSSSTPEVVGLRLPDCVPADERQRFESVSHMLLGLESTDVSNASVSFKVQRQTSHGPQQCHISTTQVRDEAGVVTAFVFTSLDMGARPQVHLNAEQEAARMDVARQLAATMNHEINNPLFVVSATLEDLLAEIDDPAEQRRLNAALDAVWKVSSAVKKLSEIRRLVTTAYIEGFPMIDLEASQEHPEEP